jgi:dihydrofolate synthase/folylpolyglutamate synthase
MNYQEALSYINDKDKFGSRLGLASIGKLLELLGNPHLGLNYLHVAGTNGKGSTSSYLAHCLQSAGYKVGLYTSPFLERFNERIQINDVDIPDSTLARITALVKQGADTMVEQGIEHPTTFEILTAIAFIYYKEEKVDYVVLEVGLGGRFDSTNIIDKSLVSVITTLDYDHIAELGDTLGKIAYQKAGIIKQNGLVVSYPQAEEAKEVIEEVVLDKGADLYFSPNDKVVIKEENEFGSVFDYSFQNYKLDDLKITMIGEYQIFNASLAVTTLLVLRDKNLVKITDEQIRQGLSNTRWKGRLEVLKRNPTFLIDGAHNLQGINQLARAIELFNYDRLILGIGILKDKDVNHMVEQLAPMADAIVVTEVNMPRKLDAETLASEIKKYNKNVFVEKEVKNAINKTIELATDKDLIVFGGSLYLIGEVRTLVNLL